MSIISDSSIVEVTAMGIDYNNPSREKIDTLKKYLDSPEKRARNMARRALQKCGAIHVRLTVTQDELIQKGLAEEVIQHPNTEE